VKLRRGIKAWSEYLAGHLEVEGRAARDGRRRREKVATVGRWGGEEDETDSPGPLDRETWGRQPARKARTKRENVLP
jgi:hypothetical protein